MNNVFRAGKMASNALDSLLANGKSDAPVIDGAIVSLGDLESDPDYGGDCEYDTYEMRAPLAPTDEIALVDYAGIGEGNAMGNAYRLGSKLIGLEVPAGVPTRVRRLALHDKFWLGEGNFLSSPAVGGYAMAEKGSCLHKATDSLPKSGYAVRILAAEGMAVGMSSFGKRYLCEVVSLGGKKGKDLMNATPDEQASYLIEELNGKQSVSDFLTKNTDALMAAAGITKETEDSVNSILYDKLQAGETITADLSDGSVLSLSGHFDDQTGKWDMDVSFAFPEKASGALFPENSGYTVKGGAVRLDLNPAELTKMDGYDACIAVYSYSLDVTGVTVFNGAKSFTVDIKGLKRSEDAENPYDPCLVIDPNKGDWTITTHEFKLPQENAEGAIKIDGEDVSWKEVSKLLSR